MTFKPGESGNPAGRPPKSRALTEILEKTGSKTVEVQQADGTVKRVSGKRLLAQLVWEVAETGKVTLPDGKVKHIEDFNDWFGVVQFIYKHIDGPPPTKITGTGKDGTIEVRTTVDNHGFDHALSELAQTLGEIISDGGSK